MVTETANYHVQGVADSPSFLMTLIQVFFVRTEAEPSQIRLSIADAFNLIQELDYNIDTFNTMINAYVQKLAANGHTTEDLFAHLIRAYKQVPDKAFKQYITIRIDQHNNGTSRMTATEFMTAAKSKYDETVKEKEWMKQDETEKQLIALTAQLKQIDSLNKKLQKKIKDNKTSWKDKKKDKKKKDSN